MKCGHCEKELHKGDTAFEDFQTSRWGHYPTHTTIFCEECGKKISGAKQITITKTDKEWNEIMKKGVQALKDLGFKFPEGGFPFHSKDKSVFEEFSTDTILIAKLEK